MSQTNAAPPQAREQWTGQVGFILSAIVARGARFLFLAWLLRRYGEPIRDFIEKRLGLLAGAAAAVVILLYILVRYVL